MKNVIKFLGIFMLTAIVFTSCSDDDDPADNDFFIGTYDGAVGYDNSDDEDSPISSSDGSVTVVKVAGKYNFNFSNGIPSITGIEFNQEGDNVWVSVGSSETSYIRIDADDLVILYINGTETWTAHASR